MNGLETEEYFVQWYGGKRVFGGLAFTCVNREYYADQPLCINHLSAGALLIGNWNDDNEEIEIAKQLWGNTSIQHVITVTDRLLRTRWRKLCWNIPFSGLSVALGGVSMDVIANDPDLRAMADGILREVIHLANTDIEAHAISTGKPAAPLDPEETRSNMWHLTDRMGAYKTSILLDLVNGRDMEVEYLFNKPYAKALQHSRVSADDDVSACKWPLFENLVRTIRSIQRLAEAKRKEGKLWVPAQMNG
jgi:2-dehydropantoate 2-reductase